MKSSTSFFIFISIILINLVSALRDQFLCCGNESIALDGNEKCENGQIPLPTCEGVRSAFGFAANNLRFMVADDKDKYFIANNAFMVRSPNYCVGNKTTKTHGNDTLTVLFCLADRIWLGRERNNASRDSPVIVEDKQMMKFKDLLILTETILFIISGVLLAITALIYFIIPQTQDIEGKCTFHQILIQSLFYLLAAYASIVERNQIAVLKDLCITHSYLFVFVQLCFFTWSAVLLYHMWYTIRQNLRMDESKLLYRYRTIGYGIPTLLIVLCNFHAHVYSFFTKKDFEHSCSAHRKLLFTLYAGMPIVIVELICAFFFVCLQRQLWNMQPMNSPELSTSLIKKFRFGLLLNAKLFTIAGLPWLLIIFCSILWQLIDSDLLLYFMNGIIFYISLEGIIIFYILVINRKRVLRGLADKFGITLRRWQQDPDSEESVEQSDEHENEFNSELQ